MLKRDYDGAAQGFRDLVEFDPSFYKGYSSLGRAYAQQGRYADAIAMLEKSRAMAGNMPSILGAIGQVYALAGVPDRAREMLAQLAQMAQGAYVPSTAFAVVHLGLAEYERALDWLEKGCDQREVTLSTLKVHPVYDPLRAEARFQTVLKRLRLA